MQDIKAVFDVGNGYIKGAIFGEEEGFSTVLVKDIVKAEGLRKGKILDSVKLSKCLLDMAERFIKKLGGDFIDEVIVGISHPEMERERITEHKRIISGSITDGDVVHLSKLMTDIGQKDNFETIKILPIYWIIDEEKKEKDPVGLQAKKLGLTADIFRIPRNFYHQILDIFDKIGLNVVDIVPNILATTEAVLDFDQKDLGTLVVDIGSNHTSYAVFEDGYPLCFHTIPIGSEDVTKDISIGMKIDIKDAESLKIEEGQIFLDRSFEKTKDVQFDIGFLSEVIVARYEEIFDKIQKTLKKMDKDGRLAGGVILSGGGSKMPGLGELAKSMFKLAAFDAKEKRLNISDMSKNKQFINILGLYSRNQQYGEEGRKGFRMNFNILGKIGKFFKDLF